MEVVERRLAILEKMCVRRFDTIDNLANEFQVSRNTIKNDILILSCSYPIYTKQGNCGGVYIVEGYHFGMKYFTDEQTVLLEKLSCSLVEEDLKTMEGIIKTFKRPDCDKR